MIIITYVFTYVKYKSKIITFISILSQLLKKNHSHTLTLTPLVSLCAIFIAEGLQTMRTLARNMTFLMKSIALGRETLGLPEQEERVATHFIR